MVMAVVRRSPAVSSWELGNEPDVARWPLLHRHARRVCAHGRGHGSRHPRRPALRHDRARRHLAPGPDVPSGRARRTTATRSPPRSTSPQCTSGAASRGCAPARAPAPASSTAWASAGRSGSPRPATRRIQPPMGPHAEGRRARSGALDRPRPRRADRRRRRARVRHAPRRPRVRSSERLRIRGRRPLARARCGRGRHPEARVRRAAPARRDAARLSHHVDQRSAVAIGSS